MSRNYRNLRVFQIADGLTLDVYRLTERLPRSERYGLYSQLRRAALSTAMNIVEGCYRRTTRDFLHSVAIAMASAAETEYALDVSVRLLLLPRADVVPIRNRYLVLLKSLQKLTVVLSMPPDDGPAPGSRQGAGPSHAQRPKTKTQ